MGQLKFCEENCEHDADGKIFHCHQCDFYVSSMPKEEIVEPSIIVTTKEWNDLAKENKLLKDSVEKLQYDLDYERSEKLRIAKKSASDFEIWTLAKNQEEKIKKLKEMCLTTMGCMYQWDEHTEEKEHDDKCSICKELKEIK